MDEVRMKHQFVNACMHYNAERKKGIEEGYCEVRKRFNNKQIQYLWNGWRMHAHFAYYCKRQSKKAEELSKGGLTKPTHQIGREIFCKGVPENKVYFELTDEQLPFFEEIMEGYHRAKREWQK